MKKKMLLCTPISEKRLAEIREYCDITIGGELKYGKGNVDSAQFKRTPRATSWWSWATRWPTPIC